MSNQEDKILLLINNLDCEETIRKELLQKAKEHSTMLEQKNSAYDKLMKEHLQLKKQHEFMQVLFANVSHELRTPLHGILGMSHLLEKTQLNINQKEYVDVTKSSAENLLVIVNDVLLLSEVNLKRVELTEKPFSIFKFLNEMESMMKFRTEEKGLQLSFEISPLIPEILVGDRTRLFQVLLNLLNNAMKFTKQGYIHLSADLIQNHRNKVEIQFRVKDTGIGIKEEKLSSLFQSFSRVHEDQGKKIEGAGLGLNIVKTLLDLLEGNIEVQSKFGQGTTFTVNIPFQVPLNENLPDIQLEEKNERLPVEWKDLKFLMIEDNTANILYSNEIFEDWGLDLDVAATLEEAKIKLDNHYDCILCDVKLPDGNGLDFIYALRENEQALNQHTPTVILTASTNENGVNQYDKDYIQSYLSKPFPPEQLLEELRKLLKVEHPEDSYIPDGQKVSLELSEDNSAKETIEDFIESLSKRFKGRTTLMVEMVKIFLEQAPVMLEVLENSSTQNDQERLRFEAHKFKSTVNIIGLNELKNFASKTENTFTEVNPNFDPKELIHDFIDQLNRDIKLLQTAFDEMTASVN